MPHYVNNIWVIRMYAPCCRLRGASLRSESCWCFEPPPPPHLCKPRPLWNWNCAMVFFLSWWLWGFLGCCGRSVSPYEWSCWKGKIKKREKKSSFGDLFCLPFGTQAAKIWRSGALAWKWTWHIPTVLINGRRKKLIEHKFMQLSHWADIRPNFCRRG